MTKKRVVIWVMVFLALSGVSYGGYYYFYASKHTTDTKEKKDVYLTVGTGDVISSIKVLGETNLLNEQKLKFNIDGTVAKVGVTEGMKVKSGDILAQLDFGELQNELKEAQINYENAQINLQKQLDKLSGDDKIKDQSNLDAQKRKIDLGAYDMNLLKQENAKKVTDKIKEIQSMELSLEKLKKESQISKEKLSTDVQDQKEDLDYKKNKLSDDTWDLEKQISDEQKNLQTKIHDYNITFTNTYDTLENDIAGFYDTLRTFNNFLEVDSEYKSLEINLFFSAKNTLYKNKSEQYYWSSKSSVKELEKKLKSAHRQELSLGYLLDILTFEKTVYDNLYFLGDFVAKGADESIETDTLSSGDISSIKSSATSLRNTSNTAKNTIDDTMTKLKNLDTPSELQEKSRITIEKLQKSLADLQKDIKKLQTDYENLYLVLPEKVKEIDLQIDKEQRNLSQARQDLDDLKYKNTVGEEDKKIELKTLREDYQIAQKNFIKKYSNIDESEEILLLKNTLKQAQISIDQVNKKIENYTLKAPFDGVIDSFSLKVGDNLSTNSQEEKYIHIVNPNMMEIKIKLDQIDIVKVKKGMEAQVTFDSYPEKIFTGSLDSIDSKPIDENGVKKYQVKMIIDKGDLNIFSGMSANVDIVFEKKQSVLLVPTMSIELDSEKGGNYVTVLKNGKKSKQPVELGLNSDGNTEILSGLRVGDKVLEINFDANMFKPEDFNGGGFGGPMY